MKAGFTLIELMTAVALFGLAVGGTLGVYVACHKLWHATALDMRAARDCNLAINRLIYGTGSNSGFRAAGALTVTSNAYGWRLACSNRFDGAKAIDYHRQASNLYWVDSASQSNRICEHIAAAVVTTNGRGVAFQLTLHLRDGAMQATNQMATFVVLRNTP